MRRALATLALCAASTAYADRPVDLVVMRPHTEAPVAVTSNVIYLNNCESGGGCVVRFGNDNATTSTSSLGQGTLTPFMYDDTTWQQVVQCVNDVFSPFNVQIVTTKPTASTYMEIMIAGAPGDIGEPSGVGGVAEFPCDNYVPNALVFDFANVWQGDVEGMCATAAQEIAHTWSLDHSTDASDPMTYFQYTGRKYYDNKEQQCGSDCVNGRGPFGQTCTGQNHSCTCTGQQNQNSYATILALFGAGNPTPPTVKITAPMDMSLVSPGFTVAATVTSPYGVKKADLQIDGVQAAEVTTAPFLFTAPTTLGPGMHTVAVVGYDVHGVTAMDQVTVASEVSCKKDSDCPFTSDVCVGGTCVVGPNGPGGLGTTCTSDTDCSSGQCASDGTASHCVDPCSAAGQCPSGYGCEPAGSGAAGFCWPGYDDGTSAGGGCDAGRGGAPVLLLGLGAMLVASRRRAR